MELKRQYYERASAIQRKGEGNRLNGAGGKKELKKMTIRLTVANLLLLVLALPVVRSRNLQPQGQSASPQQSEQESQVTVPSRPATPPYKGPQGTQRSETEFTPLSRTVTIKLHVEDPSGYF